MRTFQRLFACLLVVTFSICYASGPGQRDSKLLQAKEQKPADQIKKTIKDYIEGYYEGNAERVKSALSPALAKRFVKKDKPGNEALSNQSAAHFVEQTASQDGPKSYPLNKRKLEIKIFEIHGNIASAKAIGQDWIDYIHLGRINGKWVIVNVIWDI